MYDHIGLKVKDLRASVRFYQAALASLGHVVCSQDDGSVGFAHEVLPHLLERLA